MAIERIPEGFTDEFLDWFRDRTEAAWANYQPKALADYAANRVGGVDWQPGTRWLDGLSDAEIDQIEQRWSLRFPPDYRLFLRRLHAPDRPMHGAGPADEGDTSWVPWERFALPNWLTGDNVLQDRWDWLVDGLYFDVVNADLWPPSWGTKPVAEADQKARVQELVAAAPQLIPVFFHRYLLAEPCVEGNPIFSIYQSDIIIYGPDLRGYFLNEFPALLGQEVQAVQGGVRDIINTRGATYAAIPFWGELWNLN